MAKRYETIVWRETIWKLEANRKQIAHLQSARWVAGCCVVVPWLRRRQCCSSSQASSWFGSYFAKCRTLIRYHHGQYLRPRAKRALAVVWTVLSRRIWVTPAVGTEKAARSLASKLPDLDREREMGLRWTFMPVYWRALEPDGPVDLARDTAAWQALDAFVIAAKERNLNVLMQAPVVGGNAGGPPKWAGRREPTSRPADMDALADFAGKLAERYCPAASSRNAKAGGRETSPRLGN